MQSSHGFRKTTHFCVVFCCPETPWTIEHHRLDSGSPRDTVYSRGKGTNKQKTNKQIKCVCLVKRAVCDVALCSVFVKQKRM